MNKMIVKMVSVTMALMLLLCTFAACGDDKNKYEQDPNFVPQTTEPTVDNQKEEEKTPDNMNPFTGELNLSKEAQGARPVAIMIENTPEARPQWGISSPDVIIEGMAEGGVTRMMWLYADTNKIPDKVGPVRSARHDFVELAAGMNAIYAHWGGSDGKNLGKYMAYQAFDKFDVDHIDALKHEGSYFFRDTTRKVSLEHRGITTKAAIQKAIKNLGFTTKQTLTDWVPYKVSHEEGKIPWSDSSKDSGSCTRIDVTYSSSYKYTFKFNNEDKLYYHYLNNKQVVDGNNNQQMAVKNVIYLYVPVESMKTEKGHVDWKFEAKGIDNKGLYVVNGLGRRITWVFDEKTCQLKFYDFDNTPLTVYPGKVYIGIIPIDNRGLTVTE